MSEPNIGQLLEPLLTAVSKRQRAGVASPAWVEVALTVAMINAFAPILKPLTERLPDVIKVLAGAFDCLVRSPEVQESNDPELVPQLRDRIARLSADARKAPPTFGAEIERFLLETLTARLVGNFEFYLEQMVTRVLLTRAPRVPAVRRSARVRARAAGSAGGAGEWAETRLIADRGSW